MWPPFSVSIIVLWLILSFCCVVIYLLWLALSIPWVFVIMWPPLSIPCVLIVWSLSLLSILYFIVSICSALSVSLWFMTYENWNVASHRVSFIFFPNFLVPFLVKWRPSSWRIPFCASPLKKRVAVVTYRDIVHVRNLLFGQCICLFYTPVQACPWPW